MDTKSVCVRAPASAVSDESTAETAMLGGTVSTVSMTCTTPLENMISAVVTVDFSFRPEKTWTDLPDRMPITTWPPVTLE